MTGLVSPGCGKRSANLGILVPGIDARPEGVRRAKLGYFIAVIAAGSAFFMIVLDTSTVNLALAPIQREFGAGLATLQWLVDRYALVFASLLLSAGALGDRYGARRVFLAGLVVFTAASTLCGVATDIVILQVARIVQGIGAAMLLPNSLATPSHAFPDPIRRKKAISSWAAAGALGIAFGPVFGGILVQQFGWRSVFDVNIPVGLLALWLVTRHLPDPPRSQVRSIDLVGQILAISALAMLTYTLVEVGRSGAFAITCLTTLCVVLGAAFVAAEYFGRAPMLPLHLLSSSVVGPTALVGTLHNVSIYGLIFVLGLSFQRLRIMDPIEAGLRFLPITLALAVGTRIGGRLLLKQGPFPSLIGGHLAASAGALLLALWGAIAGQATIAIPLCVIGIGAGVTTPAMSLAVLDAVAPAQAGLASGILNSARQTGGVIGVGFLGTLLREPISSAGLSMAALAASGVLAVASSVAIAASSAGKIR
jgi:DHA2 family methylenomycin A resistance protein-like MFS transporter